MGYTTLFCAIAITLLLLTATRGEVCRDEYLVTFTNSSLGIEVNLLPKDDNSLKEAGEALTISNHYLSPECGNNYFRCNNLVVVSKQQDVTSRTHIILVPILNGVLLIDLKYNGLQLTVDGYHTLDIPSCSPTAFFRESGTIFTLCLNQDSRYLILLQVLLNTESIESTKISEPLLTFNPLLLQEPPKLSNFVFADLNGDSGSKFIYFSSGPAIQMILPFLYVFYQGEELPHCSEENTLVYAGAWSLVVYCENSVVHYDILENKWINQTLYSEVGQPFLCPNRDVHISVFASESYIVYGVWSQNSRQIFEVADGFDTGACFGAVNRTLFAYSDQNGVSILEPASGTMTLVSASKSPECPDLRYNPLLVFDDRYLVVSSKGGAGSCDASVTVVDTEQNNSVIITGRHVEADLLTMVLEEQLVCEVSGEGITQEPPLDSEDGPPTTIIAAVTGVTAGLIIAFVVVLVSVLTVVNRHKIWTRKEPKPLTAVDSSSNGKLVHGIDDLPDIVIPNPVIGATYLCARTGTENESSATVSSDPAEKRVHKGQTLGTQGNNVNNRWTEPQVAKETFTRNSQEETDGSHTQSRSEGDVMVTGL